MGREGNGVVPRFRAFHFMIVVEALKNMKDSSSSEWNCVLKGRFERGETR